MSKLVISRIDDVYIKVHCDPDVAYELSEYFTFNVPGARFHPKVKNKMWDGKIRLYNVMTKRVYAGLRLYVEMFARSRDYTVEYSDPNEFCDTEFSRIEAQEFATKRIKKTDIEYRDYQLDTFAHAVRSKRALFLSPTASGKSLMIFLTSMYLHKPNLKGKQILIVVPTTSLVHQMATDFGDYIQADPNLFCHRILSGADKNTAKPIVISTWQSIYKLPKSWFNDFHVIIGDEAHLFKAKSLTDIMSKLTDCPYRFGFTGTLDGTETHKLVLEGLFGPVKKVTTTAELINNNTLSKFKIKAIVLNYSQDSRKAHCKDKYADEIDYITNNAVRTKFINNLAMSLKGNSLILFRNKAHGRAIYNMLQDKMKENGRELYYVDGDVDGEIREDIRKEVENIQDGIIVASLGTFSTGINIKNLHNVIFASPSKSRVKVLQSIGRGLRKLSTKNLFTLYDIADDMSWKSEKNHTILHFVERVKMYNEEKFDYKIFNVELRS
jgi:superfamily II DNA or RNA helicase